jgi:hypothetical protein
VDRDLETRRERRMEHSPGLHALGHPTSCHDMNGNRAVRRAARRAAPRGVGRVPGC